MDRPKWHLKVVHMAVTIALVLSLMSIALVPPALAAADLSISVQISDRLLCCCENFTVTATITNNGTENVTNIVPSIVGMERVEVVAGPDASGFNLTWDPQESKSVNWTLHCTRPGAGSFYVQVESDQVNKQVAGPPITQQAPDLVLEIVDWPPDREVCVGEEFDIVFNITNTGNCTAWAVGVSNDITPPTKASLLDVVGLPTNIDPGNTERVTATFRCDAYGDVWIHFVPVGFACPDISRQFDGESDAITIVQQKVHLVVNLTAPEAVCAFENFNVTVNISNIGNIEALDVTPGVSMTPTGLANCTKLRPDMRNIPAGESRAFNLTCHCNATGPVEFSVDNVTGIMTDKCATKDIPEDNIELPDPVTVMQEKAHLVVTLDVPEEICVCTNFTVTANVSNTGTAGALDVTPVLGLCPGYAEYISGPSPASANISPDKTATFNWTYHCNTTGVMEINVTVTGTDNCTGLPIQADNIEQADPVNVTQQKVHLDVGMALNTTELCVCENFTVTVNITNTGNVEALNVTPSLSKDPDSGANCSGPDPAAANISANGTANFTYNCHCEAAGNVTVSVNVTGQMAGACNGTDIPEDNINLPAAVNITQYKAHLNVTSLLIEPLEVCPCQNMSLQMLIKNTGNVVAYNVVPEASWTPFELMEICSGPIPESRDLAPGEENWFVWCLHCLEQGAVNVTVNVTGIDGCTMEAIPQDNIDLWEEPITVFQKEAILEVTLDAPDEVCVCQIFNVTANITNIGQEDAANVTPWLMLNPEYAELLCGPHPAMADISVNETVTFNWTYHCNATGTMNISINATGLDMCSDPPRVIPRSKIYLPPDEVVIQQKVHLNVDLGVEPLELCVCNNFTVTVNITNWGNVMALNVTPSLILDPATGANCSGPNPPSADIIPCPMSVTTFTFNCHCAEEGQLEIGVNVTGQMGGACNGTDIPADNINSTATVNITQYPPIEVECDAEPDPQHVCHAVNFTANATGGSGNFSFTWNFGDLICDPMDNVAFTQNASHTYMCTGTYTATVTVSDGICDNVTCSVNVTIILEPPELISPPNGVMVITGGSGNVCFEWENIGCCNYTLQIWQKEEWGQKIWNINTGKNSTWCVPLMPDYYRWQVVATDICDEWVVSETWFFGVDMDIEYPYVDVTRPSGGETWVGGTNETISWFASEMTEFPVFGDGLGLDQEDLVITIFYSTDGGDTWTAIAMDGVNDGACLWMVPMIDSSQCLIKVVATDAQGNPGNDVSGLFTITTDGTAPTVTVTAPNGGESWQGGTSHDITWTATDNVGVTSVDLYLWDGDTWSPIALGQANDGTYTWMVPHINSDQCLVKVEAHDAAGNVGADTSDEVFTIESDEIYPDVTVNYPNGGEVLTGGSQVVVTWEATKFQSPTGGMEASQSDLTIELYYSSDGGATWTAIAMDGVNDGAYLWTVPSIDSVLCLIRVDATDDFGNTGTDTSNGAFTISTDTTPPAVTVTSPNGGENFAGGSAQTITWTATDTGGFGTNPIDLYLSSDGGNTWAVIALGEANDGTYPWTVPTINSDQCLVKVVATDAAGNVGDDTSNAVFTISTDTGVPTVTVTRPNGGEIFTGGSQEFILWSATDDVTPAADLTIDIYYIVGSGSWIPIASGEDNDGAFKWDVPGINSTQVLVKVEATDAASNMGFDISDNEFTIVNEPICPASFNIPLEAGWNLISLPLIPNNPKIDVVLAAVSGPGSVMQVWAWNAQAQSYLAYIPMVGGNLTTMEDGLGYWVSANGTATLTITGVCMPEPPQPPPTYDVYTGWDLIGLKSVATRTTDDYLRTIDGQYSVLWGYGSDYILVYPSPPGTGLMNPGDGFWIYVTSDGTIIPPGS